MSEKELSLKEQLLERVGAWFDRAAPRCGVTLDGAHAKLEIHLDPGDEGWDDDGNRWLQARLVETFEADTLDGMVPDRSADVAG